MRLSAGVGNQHKPAQAQGGPAQIKTPPPPGVESPRNSSSFCKKTGKLLPPPSPPPLRATKPVDEPMSWAPRLNCWALDEASITPMLEVVPSVTLAAFAGVIPRGSDASATAAVLARERLRRLERGTRS